MKKFISMVMAAAMVVSLVPATAFAANTATFKVVNDKEYTESVAKTMKDAKKVVSGPEVRLTLKDVDTTVATNDTFDITLDFDNAELDGTADATDVVGCINGVVSPNFSVEVKENTDAEDTSVKIVVKETGGNLAADDVVVIDLNALGVYLTKATAGAKATVEVGGDFGDSDALTFASVLKAGIKATLKKVGEVAEGESENLDAKLTIETTVGTFASGQEIELKLNNGFEWDRAGMNDPTVVTGTAGSVTIDRYEDDNTVCVLKVGAVTNVEKFEFAKTDLKIEAVDAKVGDVAKITVKAMGGVTDAFKDTAVVEALKVIGEAVTIEVEEDEDVPVIYSGVNVDNWGITDDSDHMSLEVTVKESVKGALDVKKAFTMTLPEGVYVTDVDVTDATGVLTTASGATLDDTDDAEDAFEAAYEEGDQECFKFARKTFVATDDGSVDKAMEMTFKMELVAEPGFEGDVVLTVGGDAFENEVEVVIAKFVAPFTVEAAQNDLIIDYRNTEVPTDVVVKEAEAGLWEKNEMDFMFYIDKMEFEDDTTFTVNDESDMEVKALKNEEMGFKVTEKSDDEAAVVTISDISLYMGRSLAAGAYDLKLYTTAGYKMMTDKELFTTDSGEITGEYYPADVADWDYTGTPAAWVGEYFTVKEGFVNIITAGRDQDDASFTKKVVVPVGEAYIVAGEDTVALDVPAYISAAGYTMLPVRAVAVALGINNNNVLWDGATKTVTILYGQRIITMVAGQKVVYVNGSAIPASASVEIKDGRTFLPMRDLATALGVTDITWDAATKTATLNGNK